MGGARSRVLLQISVAAGVGAVVTAQRLWPPAVAGQASLPGRGGPFSDALSQAVPGVLAGALP